MTTEQNNPNVVGQASLTISGYIGEVPRVRLRGPMGWASVTIPANVNITVGKRVIWSATVTKTQLLDARDSLARQLKCRPRDILIDENKLKISKVAQMKVQ